MNKFFKSLIHLVKESGRNRWLWRGYALIIVVSVACAIKAAPSIEKDIEKRLLQVVELEGVAWITIDVSGRDVLVSGSAPSQEELEKAKIILQEIPGIERIDYQTTFFVENTS